MADTVYLAKFRAVVATFSAALLLWVAAAGAIGVWTPETGEVDLDEAPQDKAAEQFRHAAALIPAGQPHSAVGQLRELVENYPAAEWAEQARYLIGMALFADGEYRDAFEEWEQFHQQHPDSALALDVYHMQRRAAGERARERWKDGVALFANLVDQGPSEEFRALCQKEKADVALEMGDYIVAEDEYMALIDYFPDSRWVPYAWFKIGQCHLETAAWVGRGREDLDQAGKAFEDFATYFPEHELAETAREKLVEVRTRQAVRHRRIAEYYLGPGEMPVAALPYLRLIRDTLSGTAEAQWAEEQIEQVVAGEVTPLMGHHRVQPLPGVVAASEQEPPPE